MKKSSHNVKTEQILVEMLRKLNISRAFYHNAIELSKVVVPGLQCWGCAAMNIPGVIVIIDHPHFRER